MLIEYTDEVQYEPGYTKNMQRFIWWKGSTEDKKFIYRSIGFTSSAWRFAMGVLVAGSIVSFLVMVFFVHIQMREAVGLTAAVLAWAFVCYKQDQRIRKAQEVDCDKYAILNAELWVYGAYNQRSAWSILNNAVFDLWKERHDVGNVEYPNKESIHDCLRMLGRHRDAVNGFLNSDDVQTAVAYMNDATTTSPDKAQAVKELKELARAVADGIFVIEDEVSADRKALVAPTLRKLQTRTGDVIAETKDAMLA